MNSKMLVARRMSLALLVVAVVEHGNLTLDGSGARPNTCGLTRLGRDLLRRATTLSVPEAKAVRRLHGF